MILCPYCEKTVEETSPSCPSCKVDLTKVNNLLGPAPFLDAHVTDYTSNLSPREMKQVRQAIFGFSDRFPQCRFAAVLRTFPEDITLRVGLFWLFNSGAISDAESTRGDNRDILLAIDPTFGRAGIIVGYGLEPFIARDAIEQILAKAHPHLEKRNFGKAITMIVRETANLLSETSREIPEIFGLEALNSKTIGGSEY